MSNAKQVYAIEGLDRLGKSTLIDGIKNRLGFYQTVHFGKPQKLAFYERTYITGKYSDEHIPMGRRQEYQYQLECFRNSMIWAQSGARLIFDRWHLGECVYAPLYRSYSGDYVFHLEQTTGVDLNRNIRLILLTEDFSNSNHFESDGESFDDKRRYEEQGLFIDAFERSYLRDKRRVCVTDKDTGKFRSPAAILEEALE